MSLLNTIKASESKAPTPVEVPEWGVTVYLRPITAGELAASFKAGQDGHFVLIKSAVVDGQGQPVFTSIEDVKSRHHKPISALVRAVMSRNKIGDEAEEDAKKA